MAEQSSYVRGRLSPRGIKRLQRVMRALFGLLTRVEVSGLENVPPGGCLMVTNHMSRFDPPLVFMTLPGHKMAILNADTYRRNPFFRGFLELLDVIWVNRGATSPSTIKAALRALKEGAILGISPEGLRSPTGALVEGKTGAAYLALAANVPVVPVAITGTEHLGRALKRLKRARITVHYGPAFRLAEPGQRVRADSKRLEQATDEIMCRIAAQLPARYRGVYADHPRLHELLAEQEKPPAEPGAPALAARPRSGPDSALAVE